MSLAQEYETLRSELLQRFAEQADLTFVSAVTSAAIMFGLLQSRIPTGFGVLVWELILTAIVWKIMANYNGIYRIGGYLSIVHEQKGNRNFVPCWINPHGTTVYAYSDRVYRRHGGGVLMRGLTRTS